MMISFSHYYQGMHLAGRGIAIYNVDGDGSTYLARVESLGDVVAEAIVDYDDYCDCSSQDASSLAIALERLTD